MKTDFLELLPLREGDAVILDTDISSDCDDAGALALLINGCKKNGACLKAVINDTDNPYASGAIDAILEYYGVQALIGQTTDVGFETADTPINVKYNRHLTEQFSRRFREGEPLAAPARDVYESVLLDSKDGSVVLITIGFLNTAAEALRLFPELFARKVRCVVAMAGNFRTPQEPEWNILRNPRAAKFFFENCPVPIVFDGFEIGYSFRTGFEHPDPKNPVAVAYELHGGGEGASFDLCAVDMAVHGFGKDSDWCLSEPFSVKISGEGALYLEKVKAVPRVFAKFSDKNSMNRIQARMNDILRNT